MEEESFGTSQIESGKEKDETSRCAICHRRSIDNQNFCRYHRIANTRLVEGFEVWRRGIEELSWERYLETIIGLKEIGVWASEVAKFELLHQRQASTSNQPFKDTGTMFHGN